ncbi:hypothetical protein [Trichothermofontia sp.]
MATRAEGRAVTVPLRLQAGRSIAQIAQKTGSDIERIRWVAGG